MLRCDPTVHAIALAGVAIAFAASAIGKFARLAGFREALRGYRLLPWVLVPAVALLLPASEALGVAMLLLPSSSAYGALLLLALSLLFTAALAVNLLRGHTSIDCGCSGLFGTAARPSAARITWWHVGRAMVLVLLAAVAMLPQWARPLTLVDDVTVVFGIAIFGVLAMTVDVLLLVSADPFHEG